MLTTVLVVSAFIIIGILSYVAIKLNIKVRQQARLHSQLELKRSLQKQDQRDHIVESLRVISQNVLNEDLNLSEATIRCKMLLDGLLLPADHREPYVVLEDVYQLIKGFDTHQSRKSLSSAQIKKQDKERLEIEEQYREKLLQCFELLKNFSIPTVQ